MFKHAKWTCLWAAPEQQDTSNMTPCSGCSVDVIILIRWGLPWSQKLWLAVIMRWRGSLCLWNYRTSTHQNDGRRKTVSCCEFCNETTHLLSQILQHRSHPIFIGYQIQMELYLSVLRELVDGDGSMVNTIARKMISTVSIVQMANRSKAREPWALVVFYSFEISESIFRRMSRKPSMRLPEILKMSRVIYLPREIQSVLQLSESIT